MWVKGGIVLLVLIDLLPPFVAYNATYDPAILHEPPPVVEHIRGRTGWMLRQVRARRPLLPPLSIHGIESIQGYAPVLSRVHVDAVNPAAVDPGGGRTLDIIDPDSPKLEALGMKTLITSEPFELERFRLAWKGSVYVYINDNAPDVKARRTDPFPTQLGLGITLLGCVVLVFLAWKKWKPAPNGK